MASFCVKKHVAAVPAQVFAWASDFARAPQHIRGIRSVSLLTPGPVGLGTRFSQTRLMLGHETTEEMEVIAFDPPHGYSVSAESHGCRVQSDLTFTPGEAGTEIEMRLSITPLTVAARMMAQALAPMLDQVAAELSQDLDDLKLAIEAAV